MGADRMVRTVSFSSGAGAPGDAYPAPPNLARSSGVARLRRASSSRCCSSTWISVWWFCGMSCSRKKRWMSATWSGPVSDMRHRPGRSRWTARTARSARASGRARIPRPSPPDPGSSSCEPARMARPAIGSTSGPPAPVSAGTGRVAESRERVRYRSCSCGVPPRRSAARKRRIPPARPERHDVDRGGRDRRLDHGSRSRERFELASRGLHRGIVAEDAQGPDQVTAERTIEVAVGVARVEPQSLQRWSDEVADELAEAFTRLSVDEPIAPAPDR